MLRLTWWRMLAQRKRAGHSAMQAEGRRRWDGLTAWGEVEVLESFPDRQHE